MAIFAVARVAVWCEHVWWSIWPDRAAPTINRSWLTGISRFCEVGVMNVRVRIQFDELTERDWQVMWSLAKSLTNNKDSIRVVADAHEENWLVAEFTMPTQAQDKAVDVIDRALRFADVTRIDSTISFPKTQAERARAHRKNERRKALRRDRRIGGCQGSAGMG
jgi:hypothetical protein